MTCLDENKVVEFIQGLLSAEARTKIEAHLDDCASCRELMAEVARLSFASSSTKRLLPDESDQYGATLPPLYSDRGSASLRTPSGSAELLPEQVLAGRFRIVKRIGRGSFGNVYEAEDLQLKEKVALKLLRAEVRDNPGLLGHLHHEIVVGRRVSHPNVCRIYDLGTCDDAHFISMALIEGEGLDRYLERGLPSPEQALGILQQIGDALEAAHNQGVVHRDLKPSNIMVAVEGQGEPRITVMDFGLSRDLRAGPSMSGALIGSPAYWSPEQSRGERATARSDLYSFGLIGCDLFGVKHPAFGAVGGLDRIPEPYRSVFERCLRVSPDQRFPSARAVREALTLARKRSRIRARRLRYTALFVLTAIGGAASVLLFTLLRSPAEMRDSQRRVATPVVKAPAVDGRLERRPRPTAAAPALDAASRAAPVVARAPGPRPPRKPGKAGPAVVDKSPLPALRPDAGAPPVVAVPAKPAPKPAPVHPTLLALEEQLAGLEAGRRARGILVEDVAGLRGLRHEVRRALAARQEAPARSALGRLAGSLQQVKIDETFVSRKLDGLSRAKKGMRLDEATEKKVAAIFAKVHDRFFSGDFQGANAHLNSIWRLLGRGD